MSMLDRKFINEGFTIESDGVIYNKKSFLELVDKWHQILDELGYGKGVVYAVDSTQNVDHFALFVAASERGMIYGAIPSAHYIGVVGGRFKPEQIGLKLWFTQDNVDEVKNGWGLPVYSVFAARDVELKPRERKFDVSHSDFVIIGTTSGTTSEQKLVYHTHETITKAALNGATLLEKEDRLLVFTSMNHVGTISVQVLAAMVSGCTAVIGDMDVTSVMHSVRGKNITAMIVFWPILRAMTNHKDWGTLDLSGLRIVISGGTLLRRAYCDLVFSRGARKILNVYGSTETPPPLLVNEVTPDNMDSEFVGEDPNLGKPMGDWEIKIDDLGNLMVKGECMGFGDDLRGNFIDGYHKTGDRVRVVDGKIINTGREPKMIRNRYDELVDVVRLRKFALNYLGGEVDPQITMAAVFLNDSGELTLLMMLNEKANFNKEKFNDEVINALGKHYLIERFVQVPGIVMFDRVKDSLIKSDSSNGAQL